MVFLTGKNEVGAVSAEPLNQSSVGRQRQAITTISELAKGIRYTLFRLSLLTEDLGACNTWVLISIND